MRKRDVEFLRYIQGIEPQFDEVYTIREFDYIMDEQYVRFVEIINPLTVHGEEAWPVMAFSPIVDQSISWTMGAPVDSEVWDSRRKQNAKVQD